MTSVNAFNLRDLLLAGKSRESVKFEPNLNIVKAHTIGVDAAESCDVTGRPGYKWVREYGMSGGVFQALGVNAPDILNLPVLVAYNPKIPWRRMIIGVDWSSVPDMNNYDGETFIANHASDHEWPDFTPGFDVVNIYPRAHAQLRTYPGTSGLEINVSTHRYVYEQTFVEFAGLSNFSLNSYQPASGSAVRVLIYLDVQSNSVLVKSGDVIADVESLTPQPPSFPLNAIYSALIRLYGDQTSISETDILDVREIISTDDSTIPATEVGQILISNDGTTLELGIPLVDANGDILTDENGHIVVV